jgi:hypothetical protein
MAGRTRLRFSVRSLLVASSLLCVALGGWEASEPRAVRDVMRAAGGWQSEVVAPYVLAVTKSDNVTVKTTYHVWLLGAVLGLPYWSEHPETGGLIMTVRPRIIIEFDEDQRLGVPLE